MSDTSFEGYAETLFHDMEFPDPPAQSHDTSRNAAEEAKKFSGTQRYRVFEFIQGNAGATDDQIMNGLGLKMNSVLPRRGELVEKGLVIDSGRTRKTRANRDAIVWIVNPVPPQTTRGKMSKGEVREVSRRCRSISKAVKMLKATFKDDTVEVEILNMLRDKGIISTDGVIAFISQ